MEPNTPKNSDGSKQIPDLGRPAYDDLRAEGVDIVAGSGMSEENEFTKAETDEAAVSALATLKDALPTPPKPEEPPKPIEAESDAKRDDGPEIPKPPMPASTEPTAPWVTPRPFRAVNPFRTEEKKGEPLHNDPSIKPLRTFKSDAEEAIRYQNVSTADIAMAEQKKKEQSSTPIEYAHEEKSKAGVFISIALVIIVGLTGGWYYWFVGSERDSDLPKKAKIQTMIRYSVATTVNVENGVSMETIAKKMTESKIGEGNISAVIPVLGATSTTLAKPEKVFGEIEMPNRISRSLGDEYMMGSYKSKGIVGAFIILKTTFFQNAFAGMLEWEENIKDDLLPLIRITHSEETTGTELPSPFSDTVISNVDARVLKNSAGNTILAYSFPNKSTILIATNEETLKFLINKLLSVRTIQ